MDMSLLAQMLTLLMANQGISARALMVCGDACTVRINIIIIIIIIIFYTITKLLHLVFVLRQDGILIQRNQG